MRIQKAIADERQRGHIELHVLPAQDTAARRVILAEGGTVKFDELVATRDLAATVSGLLTRAAIAETLGVFAGRLHRVRTQK